MWNCQVYTTTHCTSFFISFYLNNWESTLPLLLSSSSFYTLIFLYLKLRPCENSLAAISLLHFLNLCFFYSKEGLFLELLDVQKCKSPLGNFHMVSTLDWFSQTFKSTYIWVDNRVQTRQNQVHQTWFFILKFQKSSANI